MGKKDIGEMDLDQDQEELDLDENEDEDEDLDLEDQEDDEDDEDDDEDEKPRKKSSGNADLKEVKQGLAELKAAVSGGNASDKKKVKKIDQFFQSMLDNGHKAKDLVPLLQMVNALKEDLIEDYEDAEKKKSSASLQDRSWEAMDSAFDKFARQNKRLSWAKGEITQRAFELLSKSKKYAEARETYNRGKVPAARHYEDALKRTIAVFEKETGTSSGARKAAPESLDTKNSSVKGKSAPGGDGDIDVNKLDPMERKIYVTTLNHTKNKQLAKEALRDLRGKL